MSFSWAESYPEVHKMCTLFGLYELADPVEYSYKSLPSFIQDGPQCGLVSLAMYTGNPSKDCINYLFAKAQAAGFTNHGEIFCVQNMTDLAKSHLQNTKVTMYSGLLDTNEIKEVLLKGVNLLVPYDCDKNNSPCLLNGRKAHWAVVCGAVKTQDNFYVLARHGKAKNVAIWKLSELSASNAQLNEAGTYDKAQLDFKLPEGGLQGPMGLKCKSVLLSEYF